MAQVLDLERAARENTLFRRVVSTTETLQTALMCLKVGEATERERHAAAEQFFFVVAGEAHFMIGDPSSNAEQIQVYAVRAGGALVVQRRTRHVLSNRGTGPLHLYTLYSSPQHADATVHSRAIDAASEPEFRPAAVGATAAAPAAGCGK